MEMGSWGAEMETPGENIASKGLGKMAKALCQGKSLQNAGLNS
jgi:hypothetical protein